MKRFVLLVFCLTTIYFSYSVEPNGKSILLFNNMNTEISVQPGKNYQQFKFQMINFEPELVRDYANLKKRRRKKKDNTMLYVAGGLAVATGVLILANDPDNFTSNSASSVNMGIAIGGTVACGLFVAKYFIDRGR